MQEMNVTVRGCEEGGRHFVSGYRVDLNGIVRQSQRHRRDTCQQPWDGRCEREKLNEGG